MAGLPLSELDQPLGQARRTRAPRPYGRWLRRGLTGALIVVFAGLALYAAVRRDPDGGEPIATAMIRERPASPDLAKAPPEPATASVLEIAPGVAERGAPLVVVGAEDTLSAIAPTGTAMAAVTLPPSASVADWLTPIVAVVPAQLLARAVAEHRGVDVDAPAGLTKVTRTA